jgi:hypothetical protein
MEKTMKKYYNPPKACDLPSCKALITSEFSDARLPDYGVWGNVCPSCAKRERVRYGTGLGQRYVIADDGKYYKVEG